VACAWVPHEEVGDRIVVPVVREPLLSYLSGDRRRYYGYATAGITIRFFDDERRADA
jgi:hypothetical protein